MFVLIFLLVVLISGIGFLIMKSNININLEIFENFMDKFGIIFLLLLIAIMYFISYKVSCKVYKNKEE